VFIDVSGEEEGDSIGSTDTLSRSLNCETICFLLFVIKAMILPSSLHATFTLLWSERPRFLRVWRSSRISSCVPFSFHWDLMISCLANLWTNLQMTCLLPSLLNVPILCAISTSQFRSLTPYLSFIKDSTFWQVSTLVSYTNKTYVISAWVLL
jgi:hypothetical protein